MLNVDANAPLGARGAGKELAEPASLRPTRRHGQRWSTQGMSDYNALQAKIEKRMSHGYNLLATYTWSHAIDDVDTPLGSSGDSGQHRTTTWFRSSSTTRSRLWIPGNA